MEKLTIEIEQECVSTIASLSENALAKAKAVLSGLTGSSAKFKQILSLGIEELFERTLKPRLRPLLQDSYKDIKYVVTDEEYAEQEALNNFVHRFMSGLDALVEPFKVITMSTVCLNANRFHHFAHISNHHLSLAWLIGTGDIDGGQLQPSDR